MRRSGDQTKAAILSAARERFAADGYERATIRSIAADAATDPALVMRHFGTKEKLFAAAADFDLRLPDLSTLPRESLGLALVDHFLRRWEEDDTLQALLRAAATNEAAAERMRTIFTNQLAPAIAGLTGKPTAEGAQSSGRTPATPATDGDPAAEPRGSASAEGAQASGRSHITSTAVSAEGAHIPERSHITPTPAGAADAHAPGRSHTTPTPAGAEGAQSSGRGGLPAPHSTPGPEVRAGLVASQALGIAVCRYVLKLPPVAEMPRATVVDWLGPTVQRYLTAADPSA